VPPEGRPRGQSKLAFEIDGGSAADMKAAGPSSPGRTSRSHLGVIPGAWVSKRRPTAARRRDNDGGEADMHRGWSRRRQGARGENGPRCSSSGAA
jgi:hypothetical protein